MLNTDKKLKEYVASNRNKCFALNNWKERNMKNFTLKEMLSCIYETANGSFDEMTKIIDHLVAKRKVFGRTQVYGEGPKGQMDMVRNANGELEITGYKPNDPLPLKGQHPVRNSKIFRKSDNQVNKIYQKSEEKIYDLGKKVRELFPTEDNHFITFAMQAIKNYANEKKVAYDKIVNGLNKGRYRIDTDSWRVIPNVANESKDKDKNEKYLTDKKGNIKKTDDGKKVPKYCPKCGEEMQVQIKGEPIYICKNDHYFGTVAFPNESVRRRTIVINENRLNDIREKLRMSEHKFINNIKNFIGQLLQDPVNAQPSALLKLYGFNRSKLLAQLIANKIITRNERISDKDENGEPKTATMMVKFACPKKNFERKLEKLYIRLFEKNLPERKHGQKEIETFEGKINEDGEGGAMGGATSADSSGSFVTALDKQPIRRKLPTDIDETTSTNNVGNYQYTVPFIGDKETLARKNGKGGSVSINHV